jgi:methylmalonyl-CoA/ethylmalonyl-CoA epimerase
MTVVLMSWLNQGPKMYHQAYEVKSLDQAITPLSERLGVVVSRLKPAVAFAGRRIAFLMIPNRWLVELIEAPGDGAR